MIGKDATTIDSKNVLLRREASICYEREPVWLYVLALFPSLCDDRFAGGHMPRSQTSAGRGQSPFALWLRTGRWVSAQLDDPELEVKFNPNHDPANGRFTFKGGGGGASKQGRTRPSARNQKPIPVRLKDGSTVANPHSPAGILMQPPGVSLARNAAEGESWLGITANAHMIANFTPGGAMDYQRTFGSPDNINRDYIDFGNYNYGVVAAAAGYTLDEAQMAAGAINLIGKGRKSGMYFGNPRNQVMIATGWRDYMHGRIGKQ